MVALFIVDVSSPKIVYTYFGLTYSDSYNEGGSLF